MESEIVSSAGDVDTIRNNGNEHDHAEPVYVVCQTGAEAGTINNNLATIDSINHVYLAVAENTSIGIISNVKLEEAFFIPDGVSVENVQYVNDEFSQSQSLPDDVNKTSQNANSATENLVPNSLSNNDDSAPFFTTVQNTTPSEPLCTTILSDNAPLDLLNLDVFIDVDNSMRALTNEFQYTELGLENNSWRSVSGSVSESRDHTEVASSDNLNNSFENEIEESINLLEELLKSPERDVDMTPEDIISALGDDCWKQLQEICEPLLSQCMMNDGNVDTVVSDMESISSSYDDIYEILPGNQRDDHNTPSNINNGTSPTYKSMPSTLDFLPLENILENFNENMCKSPDVQFEMEVTKERNLFTEEHRSLETVSDDLRQTKSTLFKESTQCSLQQPTSTINSQDSRKIVQTLTSRHCENNFPEKNITPEISPSTIDSNNIASTSNFNKKVKKSKNGKSRKMKKMKESCENVHKHVPKQKSSSEINNNFETKNLLYESSEEFKKSKIAIKFYIYSKSHDGDDAYLSTCAESIDEKANLYDCNFCSYRNRRWCISHHLKEMHSDRSVLCDLCSDKVKCSDLLTHFWKAHKFISKNFHGKYKCEECNFVGSKYTTYQNHWLLHRIGYRCNVCEMIFEKRVAFDVHNVKIHSEKNSYSCKLCFKKFDSNEKLQAHKSKVHTPNYKCRICGKNCTTERILQIHVKKMHENNKKSASYTCNECNKIYKSKPMIRGHLSKHLNIALYVCKICKKGFFFKSHLSNHKFSHREKKFSCKICTSIFNRKDNLKLHMKSSHFIYT